MRRLATAILGLTFLVACGGENENQDNINVESTEIEEEVTEDMDSLELVEEDIVDENSYTVKAMLDGPDEWFYVFEPEGDAAIPDYDVLHIIPWDYDDKTNDLVQEWMLGHIENDFDLFEPYDQHVGKVRIFYDSEKTREMVAYRSVDGKPDGKVSVRRPDGTLFIERDYAEGIWIYKFILSWST